MKVPGTFTASIVTVAELNDLENVRAYASAPTGAELRDCREFVDPNTRLRWIWSDSEAAWVSSGPVNGALTDWSSTLTIDQGANTNIAATKTAKYSRVGRQVHAWFRAVLTGAGATGTVLISLPVPAAATSNITDIGTFVWISSGAFYYANIAVIGVTANRFQGVMTSTDANAYFTAGGSGMAVGSILTGQLSYEAAS